MGLNGSFLAALRNSLEKGYIERMTVEAGIGYRLENVTKEAEAMGNYRLYKPKL